MWLRVFEIWLTTQLLRSPAFHRAVRTVHKKVHEIRHGKDPAELGGTSIEKAPEDPKRLLQYFVEELKDQFRGGSNTKK